MSTQDVSNYGRQRYRLAEAIQRIRSGTIPRPGPRQLDEIEEICRAIERAKKPAIEEVPYANDKRLVFLSGFPDPEANGTWEIARAEPVGPALLQLDLCRTTLPKRS